MLECLAAQQFNCLSVTMELCLLPSALDCCIGIYLELQFSVWILVPATLVVVVRYIALAWMLEPGYSLMGTVIAVVGCQASYVLGLITREQHELLMARVKTRSA